MNKKKILSKLRRQFKKQLGSICWLCYMDRCQWPASSRGARVSACAGLINQLQRCQFDSRIACLENPDTAIVRDVWSGVGGTPRPVLLTGAKKVPSRVPD